ncbi:MAG: NHL repeat-containing protein [Algiphilus sp.]
MTTTSSFRTASATLAALLLAACGGSGGNGGATSVAGARVAVVATVAPDFSGSDTQLVDLDNAFETTGGLTPREQSDYTVERFGRHFYPIGRFGLDTVAKYDFEAATQRIYEYSTLDSPENPTSNPTAMAFVDARKAYVMRRETDKVWIVDPSAENEASFKLGELDLSAYRDADANGSVEAVDGLIIDDRLYVLMQRTVDNSPSDPDTVPYVAVFDIASDEEIDTNPDDAASNRKGIPLDVRNPSSLAFKPGAGLFVAAIGDPFASFRGEPRRYNGGIVRIDTADFSTTLVVDDGPETSGAHPYGSIDDLVILNADTAFFTGLEGFQNESLFAFDPSTGTVQQMPVSGYDDVNISALAGSPDGNLWVGIGSADMPRIEVVDANQQRLQTIGLIQNPAAIRFAD